MGEKAGSNKILTETFVSLYWALIVSALIMTVNIMLDTAMAGKFFNMDALAGIGVCSVFTMMIGMVQSFLVMGFNNTMGSALGRGDTEESNRTFSCMIWLNMVMQLTFIIVAFTIPEQLVSVLGARDPKIASYAVQYIRILSIASLAGNLDNMMLSPMLFFGFQKEAFINYAVQLMMNICMSLLFTQVFHMGVAGLAWGTAVGSLCAFLYLLAAYLHRPVTLHLYIRPSLETLRTAGPSIKAGLPPTINSIADFILGLVFNNMIVAMGIANGLAVYAIYKNMRSLAGISNSAAIMTSNNLLSVLFGSRDVDGMKRVLKDTFALPMIVTAVLLAAMLIGKTQLMSAFGVKDPEMMKTMGSMFLWLIPGCYLCVPVDIFRRFFAVSGHIALSVLFAIGADFIIYVPLVLLLLRSLGISAAWIAYTGCFVIFIAVWVIALMIHMKRPIRTVEDFLMLPKDYFEEDNLMNISLRGGIRESKRIAEIGDFLVSRGISKKEAFRCQLCIEEIVMHMSEGKKLPKFIDIRVFIAGGRIHFSIHNKGTMCNYLVFEPKDEFDGVGIRIVRSVAESVDYNYVMGMNVLNVMI